MTRSEPYFNKLRVYFPGAKAEAERLIWKSVQYSKREMMVVRPRRVCRRERVKGNIEAFGLSRKGGVTSGDGEVSRKSRLGEGQDFTFCDSMDGTGEYYAK